MTMPLNSHRSSFGFAAVTLASLFLLVLVAMPVRPVQAAENGGVPCAACTSVMTLVLELSVIHDKGVDQALEYLCLLLPAPFENPCVNFLDKYGKLLIDLVGNRASPDEICLSLGVCTNPSCRLFPNKRSNIELPRMKVNPELSIWTWLEELINKWTSKHLPIVDFDGDFFSDINTFRGADWRGRDCDDLSNQIYPGRRNTTFPPAIDHNCNGIKGADRHGNSYESLYCEGTDQRGFIGLGDSATAHFRLPPQYFNASELNKNTFDHLLFLLENEADWPHRSWGTGHLNDTTGDCPGPLQSIYLQLLENNQCNFRDYQNIGVNGARTGSMAPPGIIMSMARNQTYDQPALVFYALIGNDVCNSGHSTSSMTTPEQFETNVLASLSYLDTVLPAGSHVVFVGLVDGRVLWDVMHNRTHPIGCTYAELYDYLNCLYISPCWGWMNSNGTVRNETAVRAQQLNQVYTTIIGNYTYKNFDMAYYNFPLYPIVAYWAEKYGPQALYELIEPVDGFHPSQITNALAAEFLYNAIAKDHPQFVGAKNPNNANILSMFGGARHY